MTAHEDREGLKPHRGLKPTKIDSRVTAHEDKQRGNGPQRQRELCPQKIEGTTPTETTNGGSMPTAKQKRPGGGVHP